MAALIAFSGLPGVGKTTLARELARRIDAVFIRIDSIETALKSSSLNIAAMEDSGYLAAVAVAKDNLNNGLVVVADSVNPIALTRRLWSDLADTCDTNLINVEITCSDAEEHRQRAESRIADIDGLVQPTWAEIQNPNMTPGQPGKKASSA